MIGPIRARKVRVRERAQVDDVWAEEITLEEGARAKSLYGLRIYLERGCTVSGEVRYVEELTAEEGVKLAKEPQRARGPEEIGLA